MELDLLAIMTAVSVMATVMAVMFAFYGAAVPSQAVRGRLEGLMSGTSVLEAPVVKGGALRQSGVGVGFFAALAKGAVGEKLALQLERADLNIRPGEYVIVRLALLGVGFIAPLLFINGPIAYLAGLGGALVGYNLPKFYLNNRRKSRVNKLNAQLPEALTNISNSLKAGFGLLQALSACAEQLEHPISTEMNRTIHEMNIGSSAEEALLALSERAGSYDLDIVVTAILVQRTVGGNLGEILDTVAHTMRERIRIRGEIQTLTAQQKLTGFVIGLLPPALAVIFQVMSPGYINPLFTTLMGQMMIALAVVLQAVGLLVISRILQIEV
jgi:tight adherence protein B